MSASLFAAVLAILVGRPVWEGIVLTLLGIMVVLGVLYLVVRIASKR
jgi:uncharacterized membrane protein